MVWKSYSAMAVTISRRLGTILPGKIERVFFLERISSFSGKQRFLRQTHSFRTWLPAVRQTTIIIDQSLDKWQNTASITQRMVERDINRAIIISNIDQMVSTADMTQPRQFF